MKGLKLKVVDVLQDVAVCVLHRGHRQGLLVRSALALRRLVILRMILRPFPRVWVSKRTLWTDSAAARNVFEGMDSVVEKEAVRIWSAGDEALSEEEKLLVKMARNRKAVTWAIIVRLYDHEFTILLADQGRFSFSPRYLGARKDERRGSPTTTLKFALQSKLVFAESKSTTLRNV